MPQRYSCKLPLLNFLDFCDTKRIRASAPPQFSRFWRQSPASQYDRFAEQFVSIVLHESQELPLQAFFPSDLPRVALTPLKSIGIKIVVLQYKLYVLRTFFGVARQIIYRSTITDPPAV
jgi:hypothetical protein